MTDLRKVTLTVISDERQILLGLKKRGFGSGKYNGFGGKPEEGESLLDCVHRETHEEAGIKLHDPELVGILDFFFSHKPEWNQQVHVFKSSSYEGVPKETEEMAPEVFLHHEIPYEKMWVDDIHWLPRILKGKKVKGSFTFAEDGSILKQELSEVSGF